MSKEVISLDRSGILEYQMNRDPYLLIDAANEVVPGVCAKGYKKLSDEDWFFKVHFPGDPNMPGLLQIEALVQMCALCVLTLPGNKGKIVYLTSANNLKFRRKIVSGDTLYIETGMSSWKRGVGKCWGVGIVEGIEACSAEFTIVLPDELNAYKMPRPLPL